MNHSTSRIVVSALVSLILSACSNQTFDLPPAQQQFRQSLTYNNKVDMILMMDNSSSMQQYQDRFAQQVPDMVARLNEYGLDYHIAVVTSDMRTGGNGGMFVGSPKFLTNTTPGLVQLLQTRVVPGQNGSDLERGIESVYTVLQPSYLKGEGQGFLRDDSLLVMVYLSNENDYSTNSLSFYQSYFDKIRPIYKLNQRSWISNFIGVITIDGDCQTTPDFKEAGLRYMSLADVSGGRKESICKSDFAAAISNIHVRIATYLSDYPLSRKPVVSSIVVRVNGQIVPNDPVNGWTYDADGNFIQFNGTALPGASDQISVDFQPVEAT